MGLKFAASDITGKNAISAERKEYEKDIADNKRELEGICDQDSKCCSDVRVNSAYSGRSLARSRGGIFALGSGLVFCRPEELDCGRMHRDGYTDFSR